MVAYDQEATDEVRDRERAEGGGCPQGGRVRAVHIVLLRSMKNSLDRLMLAITF